MISPGSLCRIHNSRVGMAIVGAVFAEENITRIYDSEFRRNYWYANSDLQAI